MATVSDTLPPRVTRPLPDSPGTVFDKFERVLDIVWRVAFGYTLDEWQKNLLRLITELRPDGTLRHRQFLVSMGRQNGKTEIAAALALLFLLWQPRALIIGIATSALQARLVYKRAMDAIRPNPSLASKFTALTETRGIRSKTGGLYEIKAAKSAALQGLAIALGIVDEVHIVPLALWVDMVNGLGRRPNAIVVGITTAGDDDSELLKHLYRLADEGRIGHAIYEAPEARIPDDDETLGEYILAANPSLSFGYAKAHLATAIEQVRSMPPAEAIRFVLNRFVASDNTYLSVAALARCAGAVAPPSTGVVFYLDRTPSWSYAAIHAAWKAPDGKIEAQLVAAINNPNHDKLVAACLALAPRARLFAGDRYQVGKVLDDLKARGHRVKSGSLGDLSGAASRLYALVRSGGIRHAGDPLVVHQLPHVATKHSGDIYRLVATSPGLAIDAVVSLAGAVYYAENTPEHGPQLFV